MTTSTSSLATTSAPVMLSFDTTLSSAVTLHTSSGTLLEKASDAQETAFGQMFGLLAASDDMVIAESDRTRTAAQKGFDKLLQDFQRVSEANGTLRTETDQLTDQLSQLNREAETNPLQEQVRQAEQRVRDSQQEKDETIRQCSENVATATRRQLEAVQTVQDAARTQRETLESSHRTQMEALTSSHCIQMETLQNSQRSEIATLNLSHQSTLSNLQNQLNEATDNHQTVGARLTQKEQEEQGLQVQVQNLTTSLNQAQSQMPALQQRVIAIRRAYYG